MLGSKISMLATVALGLAAASSNGAAAVHQRVDMGYSPALLRNPGYRMGRRFNGRSPVRRGGNPAGTKLARKAAKGTLTISAIR